MNRLKTLLLSAAFCAGLGAAQAAPMRYTVELNTSAPYVGLGFDETATVVFDLDFDYSASQTFVVDPRVSLVSSTLDLGSALGFTYFQGADWLVVSGASGGASVLAGTDDFYISIFSVNDPSDASFFIDVSVARASVSSTIAIYSGSFSRVPLGDPSPVPTPASWALLMPALAMLGWAGRRRRPLRS